jgi:hypothetical protein
VDLLYGGDLRSSLPVFFSFSLYFQSLTLHFVVLCFDRYSRDDVIGEVLLPVNEALEEMTDSVDSNNTADNGNHSGALLFRDIAPRSHKVSPIVLETREKNEKPRNAQVAKGRVVVRETRK